VKRAAAVLLFAALSACRKEGDSAPAAKTESTPALPTPVHAGKIEKATLSLFVSAPGKTAALAQQKVRAPFAGTLVELTVTDGDRIRKGQAVGAMVARESEAALSGAREILRQASTETERRDGERAVALAERNLVRRPLTATADGTVLAHAASSGDRVSEDQEILTISDDASTVFLADVAQSDLPRVRSGQTASVQIAGEPRPASGLVHAALPGANPADSTVPVRIDFPGADRRLPPGIVGTARILVGERADATVVPEAAVLRDDVSGVARVALIAENKAHWVAVQTGAAEGGRVEILSPALAAGQAVIVSGLVGLPEGKLVAPQP
jgi:multidrug efflux pump subunit AcrA (membrane-fusion protein)